jgi:hypothetical protein
MRALLVCATVLIGLGVLLLAYYASPIRMMLLDTTGQRLHMMVPMLGGAAILSGAAILIVIRPSSSKDFR